MWLKINDYEGVAQFGPPKPPKHKHPVAKHLPWPLHCDAEHWSEFVVVEEVVGDELLDAVVVDVVGVVVEPRTWLSHSKPVNPDGQMQVNKLFVLGILW